MITRIPQCCFFCQKPGHRIPSKTVWRKKFDDTKITSDVLNQFSQLNIDGKDNGWALDSRFVVHIRCTATSRQEVITNAFGRFLTVEMDNEQTRNENLTENPQLGKIDVQN